VMSFLSRKVRKAAKRLGVQYSFFFMRANGSQLAKLAGRHTYDTTTFEGWMGIKAIKVIRAGLCPQAARDVAAQTNIGQLQTFFGSNAALRDQLAKWGHGPGDVIAVDRQGSTLIVYVA